MAQAWLEAAADLGIEFQSPFCMRTNDGREVWCSGLLPHFGGPKGTVIASRDDPDEALDVADALGYYAPGLSPDCYETYDRASFVEALSDWGWYGPAERQPKWLTARTS
jgi:hypothetical protein